MNLNLPGVVMFVAGAVLMYSAVKNRDPRDVVLTALGQKARYGDISIDGVGKAVGGAVAEAAPKAMPSQGTSIPGVVSV